MPSDPWKEAGDEEEKSLGRLLSCRDAEELETLTRTAASPLLRGLARLAIETLASEEQAEDALLAGLASADPLVRTSCARALATGGQRSQLPILQRRFTLEDNGAVRALLLDAIGAIGGAERWPFIASVSRDPDRLVRLRVLDLAARLAPRQDLVTTVLQGLKDTDQEIRDRAMGLLMVAGSKGDALSQLDPGLDEPEKLALARRLRIEKDAEMTALLRRLLAPTEPAAVIAEALVTLACLGDREELERARELLAHADSRVLRAAAVLYLLAAGVTADAEADLVAHARANLARLQAGLEPAPLPAHPVDQPLPLLLPGALAAAGILLVLALWALLGH